MSRPRATGPSRLRLLAVVSATALLVACAAPTEDVVTYPGAGTLRPSDKPDGRAKRRVVERPGATRDARPGSTTAAHVPTEEPRHAYSDDAGVGAMARVYLGAGPAREVAVEVDYVEGRAPSQAALDHIEQILKRESRASVSVARGEQIPEGSSSHSLRDIERLEDRYRDAGSSGGRATMYVLYLNGEMRDEAGTLGVAINASAAAIFADRVDDAATSLVAPAVIERAVLTHEIGHLLALVNIGYRSRHDHEDPDHPNHSRFRDSVMYWAIEDVSITSLLTGGPPSDFNRFDRDDLALLRSS